MIRILCFVSSVHYLGFHQPDSSITDDAWSILCLQVKRSWNIVISLVVMLCSSDNFAVCRCCGFSTVLNLSSFN